MKTILRFDQYILAHGVVTLENALGSYTDSVVFLAVVGIFLSLCHRIKRLSVWGQKSLVVAAFLVIWEAAVKAGLMYPASIPAPSWVFQRLIAIVQLEKFWVHALTSIGRVICGYALALVIGIPLGVVVGWFNSVERFLDPLL